jgi:hypothetical protein
MFLLRQGASGFFERIRSVSKLDGGLSDLKDGSRNDQQTNGGGSQSAATE